MKIMKYLWLIPALYTAYMFGNKIVEGFAHSEEFIAIISLIPFLKPYAYSLTPLVGLLDLFIAFALLITSFMTKNVKVITFFFVWTSIWPFVPSSLRYFGGVDAFEIVEVLSISLSSLLAYILWRKFANK